jgi:Fe-Mn family superoxide dismutase
MIMKQNNFTKNIITGISIALFSAVTLSGQVNDLKNSDMKKIDTKEFPALPYAYDALEPYIDARTMEIHYDRHHRAYFNNFVNAVRGTAMENTPVEQIFAEVSKTGEAVRNNGGGYYNHVIYWENMGNKPSKPSDELTAAIEKAFGSFDKFRETFSNAAKTRFGSGWAWLYLTPDKNLAIGSTPNQDNPLMDVSPIKGIPLLTIDVWEHAYYLKYQNKRPDYIEAFWNVVNWDVVNERYRKAMK